MYPLNRTGQKSKNLTTITCICMHIESVRQSISVKIHQHKYRFLAKRKNFSVLYFFGILLFFFFLYWKVFHILIFLHLTMEVLYRRKEKKESCITYWILLYTRIFVIYRVEEIFQTRSPQPQMILEKVATSGH